MREIIQLEIASKITLATVSTVVVATVSLRKKMMRLIPMKMVRLWPLFLESPVMIPVMPAVVNTSSVSAMLAAIVAGVCPAYSTR